MILLSNLWYKVIVAPYIAELSKDIIMDGFPFESLRAFPLQLWHSEEGLPNHLI